MKHLNDEERLAVIEGQPSAEAAEHVKQCAQCASEIESARRSIQRLENMEWPALAPRRAIVSAPLFKWALAACLALCAGFAFGRLSSPNAAQIQATVKAQVKEELRQEMMAYLNDQTRARQAVPARDVVPADTQRAILTALTDLRDQQSANYLSLRNDLETLASNADARLRSQRRLLELATFNPSISSDPTSKE